MQAMSDMERDTNISIRAYKVEKVAILDCDDYRNKSLNTADSTSYSTCNRNPLKVRQQRFNTSLETILKDHPIS